MGAARSLDQTALRLVCHQKNPSNDVKYITHMQSVLAKKFIEVYTKNLVSLIKVQNGDCSTPNDIKSTLKCSNDSSRLGGTGSSVKRSKNWSRPIPSIGLGRKTTTARIRNGWMKFRELLPFLTSRSPPLEMKSRVSEIAGFMEVRLGPF